MAMVPGGGGSRRREGKRVKDELFGDSGEARRFSSAGAEAEQCREQKYRAHELRMSLEGAKQMCSDPAAIEIASLRTHLFAVHKAGFSAFYAPGRGLSQTDSFSLMPQWMRLAGRITFCFERSPGFLGIEVWFDLLEFGHGLTESFSFAIGPGLAFILVVGDGKLFNSLNEFVETLLKAAKLYFLQVRAGDQNKTAF